MLSWQVLTFPRKVATPPRPLLPFLPGKEATTHSQMLSFHLGKVAIPPRPLLSFLQGKEAVIPNLTILLAQSARAIGIPLGTGPPSLPRRTAAPPRKTPPPPPPSSSPPQGSSQEEPNPKWVINLSSNP